MDVQGLSTEELIAELSAFAAEDGEAAALVAGLTAMREAGVMGRNIYTEQGTEITWTVPVPCPHSEQAATADMTWCETCGAVLWEDKGAES